MSDAELVLINPNSRSVYQGLGEEIAAIEPPLWCRLIAGYCRDRGWRTKIIDAEANQLSNRDAATLALSMEPHLIAVVAAGHQPSASTQTMPAASEVCNGTMSPNPRHVPTILIGGHPSALPERTLQEGGADFVCVGEGPATVDALLHAVIEHRPSFRDVPGLVWESGGYVRRNASAPLLDVKHLHGDAWDLLPMHKYRAHNWHAGDDRQPYASIYTSLGCPYKCSFCCINAPFEGNRYRMRSSHDVVSEIHKLYSDYDVTNIKITDEMFVLNRRHVREICEGLIDLRMSKELNIWAYARVDTVNADDLTLMRRAGIRWLALGIESADGTVRDGANKSFDNYAIRDVVKQIQAADIKVIGNFIFGLPHDTLTSMEQTLHLANNLNCDFANFYSAMAYPGSRLYAEADPRDLPSSWSAYAQHSYDCTPLPTATLTSADVLRFRDMAQQAYFNDRPTLATPLRRKLLEPIAA